MAAPATSARKPVEATRNAAPLPVVDLDESLEPADAAAGWPVTPADEADDEVCPVDIEEDADEVVGCRRRC